MECPEGVGLAGWGWGGMEQAEKHTQGCVFPAHPQNGKTCLKMMPVSLPTSDKRKRKLSGSKVC